MRAITMPRENYPVRFPVGEQMKSAVFKLYQEGELNHRVYGGDSVEVTLGMICPSPTYPLWMFRVPKQTHFSKTTYKPENAVAPQGSAPAQFNNWWVLSYDGGPDAPGLGFYDGNEGDTGPGYWTYVPAGATVEWSMADGGATQAGQIHLGWEFKTSVESTRYFNSTGSMVAGVVSTTSVSPTNVDVGGWMLLKDLNCVSGNVGQNTTLTLTVRLSTDKRYLMPVGSEPISTLSLRSIRKQCRVTASSLLLTNTSAALQRGGTIHGARISTIQRTRFWNVAEWTDMVGTAHADKKFKGSGELGLYTYTQPTEASLTYSNYVPENTGRSSTHQHLFRFQDMHHVNVFYYSGSATTTGSTTTATQSFSWQYDEHLEGITNDQAFILGVCKSDPVEWQKAQAAAANIVPFTENPTHLLMLAKAARMLARPYKPQMKRGLHKMHDLAQALVDEI